MNIRLSSVTTRHLTPSEFKAYEKQIVYVSRAEVNMDRIWILANEDGSDPCEENVAVAAVMK